jgi:hypothetical protein
VRRLLLALLAATALMLAGCGADDPATQPDPNPGPDPGDAGDANDVDAPDGVTLTGTFGGDAQLEGGCAWLDAAGTRYEVQYPEGYTVEFDPLRLIGPDGEQVAADGEQLTVTGAVAEDMMSFCQVGTIFVATSVG